MSSKRIVAIAFASCVLGAAAFVYGTAAGGSVSAKRAAKVKVRLIEFQVKPNVDFVAEGKAKLVVKNAGTEKHELVVVRGDDPKALPTKADGSVDEKKVPKTDQLGELEDIKPGKSKTKTFKLSAGSYVLFCNTVDKEKDGTVVSHFARGMYTVFEAG